VLNSCIEVSDYIEPYSLCQTLLPPPQSTLGSTRAKPSGIPPPLQRGGRLRADKFHIRTNDAKVGLSDHDVES